MHIHCEIDDNSLKIDKTFILYKSQSTSFIISHDYCETTDSLVNAKPLNPDVIQNFLGSIGGTAGLSGFIDTRILFVDPLRSLISFICESKEEQVYFNTKDNNLNTKSGFKIKHPNLIFTIRGGTLFVTACKGLRVTKETKLFCAPYMNIYDDHSVCMGKASRFISNDPKNIDKVISAFFDSKFSHANRKKSVIGKGGLIPFWKELINNKAKSIPKAKLLDAKLTYADFIRGL